MLRIRHKHSTEPFSRCDECGGGRGEKLKRCAQCTALYCSRECQEGAWKKRHKDVCKDFQEWKAALPAKKAGENCNGDASGDENPGEVKGGGGVNGRGDKVGKGSSSSGKKRVRKKKVLTEKLLNGTTKEAETLDE